MAFRILKVCELALEATLAGHKPWELSLRLARSPPPQAGDVVLLCPTGPAKGTWPVRGTARVLRVEPITLGGTAPPLPYKHTWPRTALLLPAPVVEVAVAAKPTRQSTHHMAHRHKINNPHCGHSSLCLGPAPPPYM